MTTQKHAKRRLFGPGTAAMAVGIVVFAAYSWATRPDSASMRYLEADAGGTVRPVQRDRAARPMPAPLRKAEPQVILAHAARLGLAAEQRSRIEAISSRWSKEKSDFDARFREATRHLDRSEGPQSIATLREGLAGYSELSRAYGARRERAWSEALAVLDAKQRAALKRLTEAEETER